MIYGTGWILNFSIKNKKLRLNYYIRHLLKKPHEKTESLGFEVLQPPKTKRRNKLIINCLLKCLAVAKINIILD